MLVLDAFGHSQKAIYTLDCENKVEKKNVLSQRNWIERKFIGCTFCADSCFCSEFECGSHKNSSKIRNIVNVPYGDRECVRYDVSSWGVVYHCKVCGWKSISLLSIFFVSWNTHQNDRLILLLWLYYLYHFLVISQLLKIRNR